MLEYFQRTYAVPKEEKLLEKKYASAA